MFADRYSAWDGALGPDALDAIADAAAPRRAARRPTSLEGYATCPQRFMLERLLRVRAVEEPEQVVRIDALSKGSVIHRIFERFYEEWHGTGPAPLAREAERRMRQIAGEECDAARDRGETGYPAMWEADRVELIEDCVRWLHEEREDELTRVLPMVAVEARFGQRMAGEKQGSLSQTEPIEIELPSGALRLHGRIDRVNWDEARSRFRVVDYKSGGRHAERSGELQGGRMLQLPLYVLAASKLLGIDPSAGAAAYVYPTRKGEFHVVDWTPEDIAARHDDVIGGPRGDCHRRAERGLHHRAVGGGVQMVPVQHHVPGRKRRLRRAQGGRRAARPARDPDPGHPVSELRDRAARERIAGDLGSNLGVEAGAGTGKTTVLVERVTNALASGVATVDQLVVITFTEKAAAELSTRVRDALERRLASAEGEEHERVEAAARDLYRCHIETIHSFAGSLLRERPVEAGIDPLFDVVDGLAGTLSFDAAYEAFQDELLSSRSSELDRALRRGFGLDEIREATELINQYRYLRPLNIPTHEDGELATHLAEFRRIADELGALLVRYDPGDDAGAEIAEGIIEWTDQLQALGTEAEQEFELLYRPRADTHLSKGSKANWGEGKEQLKSLQQEYRDAHDAAKDGLRTDAMLSLLPRIEQFVDDYELQRRTAGEPDFDDLLFWAAELLRTNKPARDYFRRRYRVVLIDEFQDTDPVQAELALLLTSDQEPNGDWRTLRPASGRLTVVGDPKQSIYRFRRADIAIYDQVRDGALKGAHEQISTNFRSNPQLLAALNAVFNTVLERQPGVQPGNVETRRTAGRAEREAAADRARARRARPEDQGR